MSAADLWSTHLSSVQAELPLAVSIAHKPLSLHDPSPMLVVGGRRPRIPPCEKRFADLMLSCWQANPDERPSFQDILSYLHTPSAIAVRRSVRHVQEEGVLEEGEGVVEGDDAGNAV